MGTPRTAPRPRLAFALLALALQGALQGTPSAGTDAAPPPPALVTAPAALVRVAGSAARPARLDPAVVAALLREHGHVEVRAEGALSLSGAWRLPPGSLDILASGPIVASDLELAAPQLAMTLRADSVRLLGATRIDLSAPHRRGGSASLLAGEELEIAPAAAIDVSGAAGRGGRILLLGGSVDSRGTLLARGRGEIAVEAIRRLRFDGPADTGGGLVRLDPRNMRIGAADSNLASGASGGAQTRSPDTGADTGEISAATLVALLASNDVIVHTDASGGAATGLTLPAGFPGTPALDATGGDIEVTADVVWSSEHFLWLLAHDDLIVRAKVQNAGGATGGSAVGIAGWDGTTFTALDAAPLDPAVYGNGTGDAYVLGPAGFSTSPTHGIAFGSRIGTTVLAARDVRVEGSTDTNFNNGWAMVGYRITAPLGGASGDIRVLAKGAARVLAGVSAGTFRWAQIGHGGCINRNSSNATDNLGPDQGDLSGDILVDAAGPVEVKSGANQAYGQIGNGGCVNRGGTRGAAGGDVSVRGESVLVQIPAGAGFLFPQTYAMIGNGGNSRFGRNTMGAVSGDLRVETTLGDLDVDARGAFQLGEAKIGNGGATNTTADEGNTPLVRTSLGAQSGDITVLVARDLLMQGSNSGANAYSQIGHGGSITSAALVGPASGAIDVTVGRDALLRSTALTGTHLRPAHIGHGGWQRGVFVVPGPTPADPPLISAERLAITDAPITVDVARELRMLGGTRQLAYTQIGHGGYLWSQSGASVSFAGAASDVTVQASTIEVRAGSGDPNFAALVYSQIGNGGGSVIVSNNSPIYQGALSGAVRVTTTGATCRVGPPPAPVPPEPVLVDLPCGDLVLAGSPTSDLAAHAWIGHGGEPLELGGGVATQAGASGDVTVTVAAESNLLQGATDFWRIGHFLLAGAPIAGGVTLDTATLDFTEAATSTSATISDDRFWPRLVHDAPVAPAVDWADSIDGGDVTLRVRGPAGTDGDLVSQQPLTVPAGAVHSVDVISTDDVTLSADVANDSVEPAALVDVVADDANPLPPAMGAGALLTVDSGVAITGQVRLFAVAPGQLSPGDYVPPATAFAVWHDQAGSPVVGANFKTAPPGADLVVTKTDSPDPVTPGEEITYTITVANDGTVDAADTTLDDTLPAGTTFVSLMPSAGCTTPLVGAGGAIHCDLGTLGASGSVVFTLTVAVPPSTVPGTLFTNTATAASATSEAGPGDEAGTAETTVGPGSADLRVTKTDAPDPVSAGAELVYTITVANDGPSDAAAVTLADTLPAGTTFVSLDPSAGCATPAVGAGGGISCSLGTLAAGASTILTLTVAVDGGVAPGTVLANDAAVSSDTAEGSAGDETASASTTVAAAPAGATLTAEKTVTGSFGPGGAVTYAIVLANAGPGDQADNPGDELTDVLPASLVLVSASATSGMAVATPGTNTVTWNGSIPAAGSVTVTIEATVAPGATPGSTVSNQAALAFDGDGDGSNESSAASDDPATAAPGDATSFVVAGDAVAEIPTASELGLLLLGTLLAALGVWAARRLGAA